MTLREKINAKTTKSMVQMYCRHKHGHHIPCDDCLNFLQYANKRLLKCRYAKFKPVCQKCKTHCYSKKYKQMAKEIMSYAGPRMIYKHPLLAIYHLYEKYRFNCPD